MILYHASRYPMCHKDGIKHKVEKTCCLFDDGAVYLGSLDYLREQYFQYCPKGIYYIFEVNVPKERVVHLEKVNHYKHCGDISSECVSPYGVEVV